MGPMWGRQGPGGPHVGPMKFAFWVCWLQKPLSGCVSRDEFHEHLDKSASDPCNASSKYPTMHHFVTEMCMHVHISVKKIHGMRLVHCGVCVTGLFPVQRRTVVCLCYYHNGKSRVTRKASSYEVASFNGREFPLDMFDGVSNIRLCLVIYDASVNWVSIRSSNGLFPVRHQALPEPMMTSFQVDSLIVTIFTEF